MADPQVEYAQAWLNDTYGGVSGWVTVTEDGITGWNSMYAIRRALQIELGVSPLSSGFGPATTAAFTAKIGRVDANTTSANLLRIVSAALWCKGYSGIYQGATPTFAAIEYAVSQIRGDLGLTGAFIDVKLMLSLTTMDAYVLLSGGTDPVREVQRWLNATYSGRADFALVPADGIFSRGVATALYFGVQYEIGMADGTANGNFGTGTRAGLRTTAAQVGAGSVDGTQRFVRLFQAALRANAVDVPFSGTFDQSTVTATRSFQSFMELPASGRADYPTWCAALVSNGDVDRSTTGFDCRTQLTAADAVALRAAGYTAVGRYTVGEGKNILSPEIDGLAAAGIRLFPIHQRLNNEAAVMTEANGLTHGVEATERCRALGLPHDTVVFFSVDFDAVGEVIDGPVMDYFRGVRKSMGQVIGTSYRIGVYGTRNVCAKVIDKGYAQAAFVAGMSTGWSGNMGFAMPREWHYNQIATITRSLPTRAVAVDNDVVSSRATPVDLTRVVSPPVEQHGSASATGFDVFFEWLVRAEVAIERGLSDAGLLLKDLVGYNYMSPSIIAHALQRPTYWDDEDFKALWRVYTPIDDTGDESLARSTGEAALAALAPAEPATALDFRHFAATLRGYQVWGAPGTQGEYGLGDLGGWMLDLLSVWGSYPGTGLREWLAGEIGAKGSASGFGWLDVVADADAWLVARRLDDGALLSEVIRRLYKESPATRVNRFYQERFGGSPANLASAFTPLIDGVDVGVFHDLAAGKIRAAANLSAGQQMPTRAEATVMAEAYAAFMASLS
ncbi:DUF1906 domain-containing protein [Kineosporia sp. J2-2]|uniref:DUF1906 domain-containing protein n=1 Tax=Kineosporia corallincola TaxID=2835133 RepID=A0ABS5TJL7_9ACTN|nr:glycoside hydrolase domain-containing protein [Kineosporia corallincola]MBT0771303.1 DUF1906 domain-containing protein [Kineosporia corallincola]